MPHFCYNFKVSNLIFFSKIFLYKFLLNIFETNSNKFNLKSQFPSIQLHFLFTRIIPLRSQKLLKHSQHFTDDLLHSLHFIMQTFADEFNKLSFHFRADFFFRESKGKPEPGDLFINRIICFIHETHLTAHFES